MQELPPDFAGLPKDVIVFDGVCVLCSAFFQFIVKHDRAGRFHFATAQGDTGQGLYRALGLPTEDFETNLVIVDGKVYTKAQGFGVAMSVLGWPWRILAPIRYLPRWLTNPAYHLVARNRYRLFGRTETCMMPSAELRSRFLT